MRTRCKRTNRFVRDRSCVDNENSPVVTTRRGDGGGATMLNDGPPKNVLLQTRPGTTVAIPVLLCPSI